MKTLDRCVGGGALTTAVMVAVMLATGCAEIPRSLGPDESVMPAAGDPRQDTAPGGAAAQEPSQDPPKPPGPAPQEPPQEKPKQETPQDNIKELLKAAEAAEKPQEDPAKQEENPVLIEELLKAAEAAEKPQEEPTQERPVLKKAAPGADLIAFDRMEVDPRLAFLLFSTEFEADPKPGAGILAHAPLPWLSRDVMGLAEDDFGAFVDFTFATIERDTTPDLDEPDGAVVFFGVGLDYNIIADDTFLVTAQLGFQYGYFGGVTDLQNGIALRAGLVGGVSLTDGIMVVYNPELALGDDGDTILFNNLGVMIRF